MDADGAYNGIALCCLNEIRAVANKSDNYESFKSNLNIRLNELVSIIEEAKNKDKNKEIAI